MKNEPQTKIPPASEASPYLLRPLRSLSEYRQAKNAAQTGMEIQKLFGMEVK